MRNQIFCFAMLFATILSPAALRAQNGFCGDACCVDPCYQPCCTNSFYVGAFGGANWLTQSHRQCCFRPKYETGYGVGGLVGYKLCCYNFRVEAEFTYRRNQIEHRKHRRRFDGDSVLSFEGRRRDRNRGYFNTYSAMVNGLYDFDLGSCGCTSFTPYIGAGVGADWYELKNHRRFRRFRFEDGIVSRRRNRRNSCKHKTRVGLQAIAGISYNICDNIDVSVDYRYHWTACYFNNHLVSLGIRYGF